MSRPKSDPKKPSTTEQLLGAASKAFARFGFLGARLEDIAQTVGITRPSLLYHFESKDNLYDQVVRRAARTLREALEAAAKQGGPFPELLERLLDAYLHFLKGQPELAAVLLREMVAGRGARTRVLVREVLPIINWIEEVLTREGKGKLRADLPLRAAILQVTTGALVQYTAGPMRRPLWGPMDHTKTLARALFLAPSPGG